MQRPLEGALESVRKAYEGLPSLRSMRRIEAMRRNASALSVRFSKSFARRRQRLSHAKVRSTTQRIGSNDEAFGLVRSLEDLYRTMWQVRRHRIGKLRSLVTGAGEQLSKNGYIPNSVDNSSAPPSRSWISAGCTMACSSNPNVSTRICRFLPVTFLPAS